jgi:nitric oxide dioxygenase
MSSLGSGEVHIVDMTDQIDVRKGLRMLTESQRAIIRATVPALQQNGQTITTYFYKSLFLEHPGLLNIFNKANQREGGQAANLAASILMYAAHIDHLDQLGGMVERIAHKHGSMEVQPEHYPIVGHHLLLAIRSVLGDAATEEVIDAWGAAYGQLADIFVGRESQLYEDGAAAPDGWRGFKLFTVQRKVRESSTITSFYLVPTDGQSLPSFAPGQYLSLKLKAPNDPNEQIRQYSLSCAPNKNFYRISVGRELATSGNILTPDGIVSTYLHDHVQAGDTLAVHVPLGDFVLDETSTRPVILISGGTGITPMLSMFERLAHSSEREVCFVHGTGNRAQHAFGETIREIAQSRSNLKAVIFYNEVEEDDIRGVHHDESGYIDADMLKRHLSTVDADFYFCGPVPFLRAIERALDALGVPLDRRRSEAFAPDPSLLMELESAAA